MSKRTLALFSLLVFFIFCLSASAVSGLGQRRGGRSEGNPPKLKIELQLFKTQYLLREPIWAKCEVTNVGTEPGKFYFDNLDALVIKDSTGQVYACSMAIERVPITIKPGTSLEKAGNLLGLYGVPEDKFRIHRYLPVGQYTICYELNQSVGSDAYKVYAKSQLDTFEVLEPESLEHEAMTLLMESYNLEIEKEWDRSLSKLNELLEKFPKSSYVPCALFEISGIHEIHFKNLEQTQKTYHIIVDNHANSGEAITVLSYLVHHYKTKPDIRGLIDYLDTLMKKHPGTAVAREAGKQLEKLQE